MERPAQVVVAGHICLDIIPAFGERKGGLEALLVPGKLVIVGPAVTALGGAVSNTGLALHRLGVPTRLLGKIGDDLLGRAILEVLRGVSPALVGGMIISVGEHSSYTVVLNPAGVDRIFLHCPGANDTFGSADVAREALSGARLFHFGYPPLMRRTYADGGQELARLFAQVKEAGLTTSLDMAMPDPVSEAGRVDWLSWLQRVLPHVDLFLPSMDEMLFMLDRERYERRQPVDGPLLGDLAGRLLDWGAAVAGFKCGDQGLYLRTTGAAGRLATLGAAAPGDPRPWQSRELFAPCFQVNVVGTTGAGDCTIAGFLAGLLAGGPPETALLAAVAAGGCSVERADATSGIPDWPALQQRIQSGWQRYPVALSLPGWNWNDRQAIWRGPHDGELASLD